MKTERHQSFLQRSKNRFLKYGFILSLLSVIFAFKIKFKEYNYTVSSSGVQPFEGTEIMPPVSILDDKPKVIVEKLTEPPKLTATLEVVEDLPVETIDSKVEVLENQTNDINENTVITKVEAPPIVPVKPASKKFVDNPEVFPEFPGGEKALLTFLAGTEYNEYAMEIGLEGTVYVSFVIDENGNVTNAKVVKGVDPLLDEAALTRIKQMPIWAAGMQGDSKVPVRMNVPIKFTLN